ncbi:cache domain-containing protein, partial [uncultured Methylobacterium sp.]|uniref:cache domain-containing protein n=1 Tax=uncultured Methylobacterium sp. TaxID=157278 RepID=UPI0035CC93BD
MRLEGGAEGGMSSIAKLRQSSATLSRRLAVAGLLLSASLVAAAAFATLELQTKQLLDARRELMTLNTVLAEETARAMQSVDLVLRAVIRAFGDESMTPERLAAIASSRGTHESLKEKIAGIPQLDAVTIIGADGRLINFSRSFPAPVIDLSDRDYFIRLRDTEISGPFVTEPVQNRGNGTWTIYLARRLVGEDGRFVGLVLGAIDLRYFDSFYRSLKLGGEAAISLWRKDGMLLTREPAIAGVGQTFRIKAFAPDVVQAQEGYYEDTMAMDGRSRLVATRAIQGYPLVVNVTRTRDEVLADWNRQAALAAGATALCIGAIAAILWTLARQSRANMARAEAVLAREDAVRARDDAEAQLRQSQKMEAMG